MKKCLSLLLLLCLLLTGCGSNQRPAEWAEDWTAIAPFLAAEDMENFTFGESADAMGLGGVYYATWVNGEQRDFVNAAGESALIFDAQIYVIAQAYNTEAEATTALAQWIDREKQYYRFHEEFEVSVNDREYTFLTLRSDNEANPYNFGCAAFTLHGSNAVCVELVCSDAFTADTQAVLEQFLGGLHYAE